VGTEKCQFETEKCQFETEKCRFLYSLSAKLNATLMYSFWPEIKATSAEYPVLKKAGCLINPVRSHPFSNSRGGYLPTPSTLAVDP
jgi:hypothetical protein